MKVSSGLLAALLVLTSPGWPVYAAAAQTLAARPGLNPASVRIVPSLPPELPAANIAATRPPSLEPFPEVSSAPNQALASSARRTAAAAAWASLRQAAAHTRSWTGLFDGAARRRLGAQAAQATGTAMAGVLPLAGRHGGVAHGLSIALLQYDPYIPWTSAQPILRQELLPDYALWAAAAGLGVALAVGLWKALRPAAPAWRRKSPWLGALKMLTAGAITSAATFGAALSYDVFSGPADAWIKVLVGAAWGAAAVAGGFFINSVQKNRIWSSSKSAQDVLALEEAVSRGDAGDVERLGKEAAARRKRIAADIAQAQRAGLKTLDNRHGDSLAMAKRYAAFDGLVAGRADLNVDALSKDPAKRIGGQLPQTWNQWLSEDEARAKGSKFEGTLALRLKSFNAEIVQERAEGARIEADFKAYEEFIPRLFRGGMAEESKRAQKDWAVYEANEVDAEQKIHDGFNAAMRKRVSDRIYGESAEFREHRDRFDRLVELFNGKAATALGTARDIDSKLASAISHLHGEQAYLALAAANTHVPVTRTRTSSNGQTETYTTYEDHSGPYRALAAAEAVAASSAASAARSGFARLPAQIVALHNDATMRSEGLLGMLPEGRPRNIDGGNGALMDWFMPPLLEMFSAMASAASISSTRSGFAPVLGALERLSAEVASRRDAEDAWLNAKISADLERQMAQALSQPL